jgi:hypothetical protein
MRSGATRSVGLALLVGVGAQCSGGAASHAPLAPPVQHRPEPTVCPSTRSPISVGGDAAPVGPNAQGLCLVDADCKAGKNGRCANLRGGASCSNPAGYAYVTECECTYDACFSDADCPAGTLCNCDPLAGNACLPANCRVDSDCASGYCSPSQAQSYCSYATTGGYYCHTDQDSCDSDADCPEADEACTWQPQTNAWQCATAATCNG